MDFFFYIQKPNVSFHTPLLLFTPFTNKLAKVKFNWQGIKAQIISIMSALCILFAYGQEAAWKLQSDYWCKLDNSIMLITVH